MHDDAMYMNGQEPLVATRLIQVSVTAARSGSAQPRPAGERLASVQAHSRSGFETTQGSRATGASASASSDRRAP
eukprot:1389680-Prymnesium_polylepis.1